MDISTFTLSILKINTVKERAEKTLSVTSACISFQVNAQSCNCCWPLGLGGGVSRTQHIWMLLVSSLVLIHQIWCSCEAIHHITPMTSPHLITPISSHHRPSRHLPACPQCITCCRSCVCRDPSWRCGRYQERELPFLLMCCILLCLCLAVLISSLP